ncbi:Mitochondrial zinc maintenance protein 1, mitochondrial [Fulvia fulva]|uniref:Mitochondrial zinc maintenance protein 1, mitochondrial n=1 Tax=Passalora fulva TaxID=5499 RepID=A0A9Q8PD91_PASFU|nr:Mitochondrial zinc maintenance protein 1, mitochondrial [Fulvia fulva]KAK4619474.1 Mitochondrial zinc maintenance protein 1, mitochondrial [Fulvia fulva]KAK4620951.1 Mitochondrial zinc maintenance protein 1, mitochondrial [Fulvia fulva]UJO20343.1 Mitochondrial zinc maintenance protein 1, mitochondrial [Fulvia fulva]WPV17148.1 Mitochondrial zinc maintenance protein 1, mitochondrial [Fulvia fulva]WPV32710.1 Mitochondrial zinc maintenance protein 1, mitochondrial [Fulvia fulva]
MSVHLTFAERLTNRFAILSTYRALLRATKIAFASDQATLRASRDFARSQFREKRTLKEGGLEAGQAVEHAQGVTRILRENVVQGRNVGGEKYKLNIHEHTQRLDNDEAGRLKGTKKSFKEIKDSIF